MCRSARADPWSSQAGIAQWRLEESLYAWEATLRSSQVGFAQRRPGESLYPWGATLWWDISRVILLGQGLSVRFPGEVHFTILPSQRTEGNMQAVKIIDIGCHKQRVVYAYTY